MIFDMVGAPASGSQFEATLVRSVAAGRSVVRAVLGARRRRVDRVGSGGLIMLAGGARGRLSTWIMLLPVCLAATGRPSIPRGSASRIELRARALLEPDGRYAGTKYQAALRARRLLLRQQSSPGSPSILNWTEIGPGNVGGRLNAIWVDPSNARHLLAGSASGGLWQSNDGGTTWSAVSEFPGALTIGAIAQLPNGTLLVGTGDPWVAAGDGIFSSTDGGTTWSPIGATAPSTEGSFWLMVDSIAVSSRGIALASTYGGIARSTDGQTWYTVWSGIASNAANSLDVAFDPNQSSDAVADDEGGGVLYSTDAGQTWRNATGLPDTPGARVSLGFDPSVAGSVYALVDDNDGTSPSGEVFHSTDDGASWTLLAGTSAFVNADSGNAVGALCDDAIGGAPECQGSYDNVIVVEPHPSGTPPTLLAGGIDIFTSIDGGTTWTETGSWLNTDSDYIHADQHDFTYDASSSTLYIGNDGGFYKQRSANTWSQQNEGLADTQFYTVSGHATVTSSLNVIDGVPVTPIVAGAQDNGTLLYQGYSSGAGPQPDDWIQIVGGDGGTAQVDPADGNDVYAEYVYLTLGHSSQGGPGGMFYATEPPDTATMAANFVAPFLLLPNSGAASDQMLAGGASLWLGTNIETSNPAWSAINASGMPASTADSNYISSIAMDPDDYNDIWVGYDDGELWNSDNAVVTGGAGSWNEVGSGVLPGRTVESIWVVPGQSKTVYVTFGGYPTSATDGNVWMTTDGGGTWTDVGSGLPRAPVYSLVTHPAYSQILYAGTLTGVYTSSDGGSTWNADSLGPANVEVRQLAWFDTSNPDAPTLLAATFGRGAWLGSPAYNPTPTLTSIDPAVITVGSSSTAITLTGSGFVQGLTTVTLDGNAVTVDYESSTQLQVTVSAATLSSLGTHTFVARNPIPGGGTSAAAAFTVAAAGHSGGGGVLGDLALLLLFSANLWTWSRSRTRLAGGKRWNRPEPLR
jgi:IPT/TIG domain